MPLFVLNQSVSVEPMAYPSKVCDFSIILQCKECMSRNFDGMTPQGIPYCCTYATCSCSLGYFMSMHLFFHLSVHTTCNSVSDGLPTAQQAHDIKPMSDQRRCDVMTLIRCCFDVMCLLGGSHVTLF